MTTRARLSDHHKNSLVEDVGPRSFEKARRLSKERDGRKRQGPRRASRDSTWLVCSWFGVFQGACRDILGLEVANAWPPSFESENARVGCALSLEEWLALAEDEAGEFVDGHLVEEEVPDFTHELTVSWLLRVIGLWLGGRGFVVGSELKILTAAGRGRKPDLSVILPGSKAPPRTGPVREPPDIVIEVVTPTPRDERRDRVEKMSEYARFGVPYFWLVDPTLGAVEMFERTPAGNYQKLVGVTSGCIDPVPGCPGLVVDVDALWAELARLRDAE